MTSLDVILPVYNEVEALPQFLTSLLRVLEREQLDWRIHLVVDRSEDGTEEVVRKACSSDSRIRALLLSARFGHQESLLAGICAGRPDVPLLMMDADGQHPPEVIPEMLRALEAGADVVATDRRSIRGQSVWARFSSNLFYRIISSISGLSLDPGTADFRMIGSNVAEILREAIGEQSPFLRGLIGWMGFNQVVVSFEAPERIAGEPKYTYYRRLQFARHAIIAFSLVPLRLATPVGIGIASIAIVYGLYLTGLRLLTDTELPPGWMSLVIIALFLGGLQLAFIGVLGEYLANVYSETKRRPRFIVRQTLNYGDEKVRRFG